MIDACLKKGYDALREPVNTITRWASETGSEGAKYGALGFFCGLTVALIAGANPLASATVCATVVGGAFFINKLCQKIFKTDTQLVGVILVCVRALTFGSPGYLQISLLSTLLLPHIWEYASRIK